jgi:hypothetical protein
LAAKEGRRIPDKGSLERIAGRDSQNARQEIRFQRPFKRQSFKSEAGRSYGPERLGDLKKIYIEGRKVINRCAEGDRFQDDQDTN